MRSRTDFARGLLVIICGLVVGCAGIGGPPVAPVRAVTDDFYGTKVVDPYRYMENLSDPQVQKWIKGQANYAIRVLHSIPGRDELLARIQELDAGAPYRIGIIRRWRNGDFLYFKTMASDNLAKVYLRKADTGAERLLIDPQRMSQGSGTHYSIEFCEPSRDGKYIAYGVAVAGSEQSVLHILDVTSGKDLPETIDRMEAEYTPPHWLADGGGFVYSRRRLLPPDAPPTEGYKQSRAFLHRLGTDPAKDPLLVAMNTSPNVPLTEADFPSIILVPSSRWAILKIKHGDANELTLYAAPTASLESMDAGAIPWAKICDVDNEVEDFAPHADDIYLMTAAGAPHYRIVRTSLEKPDFATAQTVVPAGAVVVDSVSAARDALYIGLRDDGLGRVGRLPYASDAKMEILDLPAGVETISPILSDLDVDGILAESSSWTKAGRIYGYDPQSRAFFDTNLPPRGKFDDVNGYEAEEVVVKSHDGVGVPLSILHKTGIKLDGSHPTLVSGYGAYGISSDVSFSPVRLAWLERGGVIAFAHVRGGGELGKEWHLAGQKATKPNTWKDFIACCEYLVQKGYTSPAKLAGMGGSAGGILIGRAITERPDLFAAALIEVGCTDTLRMETTTNGVPNIPEFGSVKTKEGFDGLYEMSAYAHVKDGTKYPAVVLTHGINDPRVEPWMSAKMTARLQAAASSGKPILFRVDYDAGHGIRSTKSQRQEELADLWAFLLWQME